jgi:hypothetical protein
MTIGMVLDYINDFIEMQKPAEQKVRKASQRDMDLF